MSEEEGILGIYSGEGNYLAGLLVVQGLLSEIPQSISLPQSPRAPCTTSHDSFAQSSLLYGDGLTKDACGTNQPVPPAPDNHNVNGEHGPHGFGDGVEDLLSFANDVENNLAPQISSTRTHTLESPLG